MEPIQPGTVEEPIEDESDLDDGLTALEYARLQSIARDHLNPEDPLSELRSAHQNHVNTNSDLNVNALEDHALPSISTLLPEGFTTPRESLFIPKESLSLLASVTGKLNEEEENREVERIIDGLLHVRSRGTNLEKLELPVLRSDHELDVACWGGREEPVIEDLNVPREPLDEGRGEGLSWGRGLEGEMAKIEGQIAGEKLMLDTEGVVFLMNTLRDDWCAEDDEEVWARQVCYKRVSLHLSSHLFFVSGVRRGFYRRRKSISILPLPLFPQKYCFPQRPFHHLRTDLPGYRVLSLRRHSDQLCFLSLQNPS